MSIVNLYDAKNRLSKLVTDAINGQEVIIARNGRPVVRLTPIVPPAPRELGHMRGLFTVPDDFDGPLPPEVLAGFSS